MLLFRSLTLGLLGAILVLLAARPREPVPAASLIAQGMPTACPRAPRAAPPTVIDVAAGVAPDQVPALVKLRAGERVLAVDDAPVPSDLAAGAAIAASASRRIFTGTRTIDLSVGRPRGEPRRVLVLLH